MTLRFAWVVRHRHLRSTCHLPVTLQDRSGRAEPSDLNGFRVARDWLRRDSPYTDRDREVLMLLLLALLLALAWVGAFVVMHVTMAAIHLLLLFAVVSFVLNLVRLRWTV
jgi:hypothetical protein